MMMRYVATPLFLTSLLLLSGCGSSADADEKGTDVSINMQADGDSSVAAGSDGDKGKLSITTDGFEAKIAMPKIDMGGGDFEIDGVKLYPGATVTGVNINANDKGGSGASTVDFRYTAPATPDTVRDWYAKEFKARGVTATTSANGIAGISKDGDNFTMTFAPSGEGKTSGTIRVTDKKS
jgi:hypothetical protein